MSEPAAKSRPANGALDILRRARSLTDSVIVCFSCGKESLTLLDLCQQTFARVEAFYWHVVPGLSFHERAIAQAERRYPGLRVRRLPHFLLADLLRHAVCRPPTDLTLSVPKITLADLESEMRRQTGLHWIASGQKRSDSLERCGMISACDGINHATGRLYPLAWWRDPAVLAYLKRQRIPLAADYGVFGHSYGGDLTARSLAKLREHFPADFERVLEYFPFVRGECLRQEWYGDQERHIPAVTRARFNRGQDEKPEEGEHPTAAGDTASGNARGAREP